MDPLTHAALGAVAGVAVTRAPTRHILAVGALAALAPDLDVLVRSAADPLLVLTVHRQFTHAVAAAPLGAAIIALLYRRLLARGQSWRPLFSAALAGWVSACLLDACTSYGTRLGWPFSDESIALSIVAVVDPLATVIVLATVALLWRRPHPSPAWPGLVLMVAYLGLGAWQHQRAEHWVADAIRSRGHEADAVTVKPTLGNLLLWRTVYRAQDHWWVDAVYLGPMGGHRGYEGGRTAVIEPGAMAPDGRQGADMRRFAQVSQGYLAAHPQDATVIGDIRYAMQPDGLAPLWGVRLYPEQPDRPVGFETFRDRQPGDGRRFLRMMRGQAVETPGPME